MRLHRLQITAFGIFPGTAQVDFDSLHEAGLFLLTGPTGAGKSTVLDAVCFALYGDVPGDRSTAKRFRSDLAKPNAVPRVSLELTLNTRRFRFDRTPSWVRPKKRGVGTTQQQASVRVHEWVKEEWRLLTTRLDEAGHLASDLIGMSLAQFCQVAMLPQGQFQAFLRARSEDRHRLLSQLFRTERFELVERWLRDHRLALRQRSEAQAADVASLVHRLSEASRTALPQAWSGERANLDIPAREGNISQWCSLIQTAAVAGVEDAQAALLSASTDRDRTRSALAEGQRLAELQGSHHAARQALELLDADAERQNEREERLDAALRASSLVPVLAIFDQSETAFSQALETQTQARDVASDALSGQVENEITDADIRALRDEAAVQARVAEDLNGQLSEVGAMRTASESYEEQLDAIRVDGLRLAETRHELSAELAKVAEQLTEAQAAAEVLLTLRPELAALTQKHAAITQMRETESDLVEAEGEQRAAIDAAHQAKERWLALREKRLSGMAAEIAQALVVGEDCPVCGSVEHPHPATMPSGSSLAADEAAARTECDDLELTRFATEQKVRDLKAQLELLKQAAGSLSPDDLAITISKHQERLDQLATLAEQREEFTLRQAALQREVERIDKQANTQSLREAGLRATYSTHRAQELVRAHEVALRFSASFHERPKNLTEHTDRLRRHAAALDDLLNARQQCRAARGQHQVATRELRQCVTQLGFDSIAQAREAALPQPETDALLALTQQYRNERAALSKTLDAPELLAANQLPSPDLAELGKEATAAADLAVSAEGTYQNAQHAAKRVSALTRQVEQALEGWGPIRENLDVATNLATLVEGRSVDNTLQMRLSAYVLAHRLGQVVQAANQRLVSMSDRRYTLQHTAQRGAGETRGGLSLLVRDDWSGEARDPATLSGGETFVVSLALALGLADVLIAESGAEARGASRLESLFVDEGFGSLDANTLDDVLDTLDGLREGGRVVGVVSHVSEMRDRIPTQLQIVKTRHGSTIRQAQ